MFFSFSKSKREFRCIINQKRWVESVSVKSEPWITLTVSSKFCPTNRHESIFYLNGLLTLANGPISSNQAEAI